MKAWEEFYPFLLPSVIGCPNPVMDHALRRAAIEFFERSHVWKQWLADIPTLGLSEYALPLGAEAEMVKIERANLGGRVIDIIAPDTLPDDWQYSNVSISDCVFTEDRKTVTVLPVATTEKALRLEVVLKPSNAATAIPDAYFDHYAELIATGAKGRLCLLKDTNHYNPVDAQDARQVFTQGIQALSIQQFRAFSSTQSRARLQTY